MTHTLYYKFILGYLLFGFLGFVTIATVSSNLTYEHLIEQKAEALYDEATMIADNCSKVYEGKYLDLATAYPQLDGQDLDYGPQRDYHRRQQPESSRHCRGRL